MQIDAEVTAGGAQFEATTRDLSRGGICFVVAQALPTGSTFTISLSLVLGENTFSEPLVLEGAVVWCTALGDGFQIGGSLVLNGETREYLQMFLNFLADGVEVGDEDEDEDEDGDQDEKGLFA